MFYDKFIKLCNLKRVSPSRAALDLNLSKSSVNKWKNGSTPSGKTLQMLADYFNVSVDYLINGEPQKSDTKKEAVTFDDFTYAMYNHSAELTDEEKKMLLEMAEFMKQKRGL